MSDFDVQSVMEKVVSAFQPEKAAGIDAAVQFHLTGEKGGDWVATIKDQKLSVTPGTAPNPNLMFSADAKDLEAIYTGKLNPMQAYMQGKVQFKGDMGLAMRLMNLFKQP